jgi:hypothetical protein
MTTEILTENLSANPAVSAEPPGVREKKERGGRKGRLLFLVAIGLGIAALASITLLAPVTFYGRVGSPGSIGSDSSSGGDSTTVPSALASSSAAATDGKGTAIGDNGVTESAEITISGYSGSTYSTELRCSIDSLPTYCSGSPVTLSGLPPGEHIFTVIESVGDKTAVRSFSWDISE